MILKQSSEKSISNQINKTNYKKLSLLVLGIFLVLNLFGVDKANGFFGFNIQGRVNIKGIFRVQNSTPSFVCGTSQITDADSNSYNTVQIGTQCWMAENMRTTKYPDGSAITKGDVTHGDTDWGIDHAWYSCPPNATNNGEDCSASATLGLLYQWSAAMKGSILEQAQGICPTGWHIPTDTELYTLENYLNEGTCSASRTTYECDPAGSKLAGNVASQNWTTGTLTNHADFDTSGFNAPASGTRYTNGNYYSRSDNALFWSSSQSSTTNAWGRSLYYNLSTVSRGTYSKAYGFSIRCVKD